MTETLSANCSCFKIAAFFLLHIGSSDDELDVLSRIINVCDFGVFWTSCIAVES